MVALPPIGTLPVPNCTQCHVFKQCCCSAIDCKSHATVSRAADMYGQNDMVAYPSGFARSMHTIWNVCNSIPDLFDLQAELKSLIGQHTTVCLAYRVIAIHTLAILSSIMVFVTFLPLRTIFSSFGTSASNNAALLRLNAQCPSKSCMRNAQISFSLKMCLCWARVAVASP